jgi:hypothetical protein
MDTQKFLIFGLGVLGGYLLFKYSVQPAGKDISSPAANADLQKDCNERWQAVAQTIKAGEGDLARLKADFMAECLTGVITSFEVSNDSGLVAEMPPPQRTMELETM